MKMKAFLALVALVLAMAPGVVLADVVTPSNMGTWAFAFNYGLAGGYLPCGSCQSGSMVTGPATPPLGVGSAMLQIPSGTNDDGAASIATSSLNGVALADLTALSYSTYDTANNGQQFPYIQLNISYTNDASNDGPGTDTLFFEPPYQTPSAGDPSLPNQGAPAMNTWQTWNALEGGWWDNNNVAGPGTGVAPLSTFLSFYTDPTIVANVPYFPNDGLALTVGFADNTEYTAYVDNVTIGVSGSNTTYDFEPNTPSVPEPSAIMTLLTMLLAVGLVARKRIARD